MFYKEHTIHALKESFEGTLEALPEPLLVQQQGRTVYSNSAFREQLTNDTIKDQIDAILRESLEEPLGDAAQPQPKKI